MGVKDWIDEYLRPEEDADPNAPERIDHAEECSGQLVIQVSRKTGELFLGCSKFPACIYAEPWPR